MTLLQVFVSTEAVLGVLAGAAILIHGLRLHRLDVRDRQPIRAKRQALRRHRFILLR